MKRNDNQVAVMLARVTTTLVVAVLFYLAIIWLTSFQLNIEIFGDLIVMAAFFGILAIIANRFGRE